MNVFQKAKANPTKSAGKVKEKVTYIPTKGLDVYAQIDALEKQLATLKKTALKPEIQELMITKFMSNQGETYYGSEGKSTGTLIYGKRASTSKLSDTEIELCLKHNIPLAQVEGDFKLNVDGLTERKLQEVSDAISKIRGLPENFIEFDASKARTIASEESQAAMWKINDKDTIKQLMPVVGVFTIKPQTAEDMETVMASASALVLPKKKK